jgi:hypothetical protein
MNAAGASFRAHRSEKPQTGLMVGVITPKKRSRAIREQHPRSTATLLINEIRYGNVRSLAGAIYPDTVFFLNPWAEAHRGENYPVIDAFDFQRIARANAERFSDRLRNNQPAGLVERHSGIHQWILPFGKYQGFKTPQLATRRVLWRL